jgi:hypothetical protein
MPERKKMKATIWAQTEEAGIKIYDFPDQSDDQQHK